MAPRPTWRCGVASLMGAPPAQGVWGDRPWTRHRAAGKRPAVVHCPRAGWGRGDARVVPHGRGHPSVGLAWRHRPVHRAGNSSRAARRARQGRGRRSTRPWRQDGSCGASPATVGRDHAPRAAPTLMEWRSWRVRHAVRWRAAPAHRRATSRARPSQPASPRARRPAGLTARPCPRHTRRGLCGCTGPTGGGGGLRPTPPAGVGANGPGDLGGRAPMAGTLEQAPPAHRQDAPPAGRAWPPRVIPPPPPPPSARSSVQKRGLCRGAPCSFPARATPTRRGAAAVSITRGGQRPRLARTVYPPARCRGPLPPAPAAGARAPRWQSPAGGAAPSAAPRRAAISISLPTARGPLVVT